MSYVLYIPVKCKDFPSKEKTAIDEWVQAEKENGNEVIVTYYGEKGLKELPPHSKIYVVMHGIDQAPTRFSKNIPTDVAILFPSLSTHLRITDGKNTIHVMDAAKRMIEDGLYDSKKELLRIKLFFCDAVDKAYALALAFTEQLKQDKRYPENDVRIDYYQNRLLTQPIKKTDEKKAHKYGVKKGLYEEKHLIHRASEYRHSFFSKTTSSPKLTKENITKAIQSYNDYKSSRWLGLSGFLGLNNLFTSSASSDLISTLHQVHDTNELYQLTSNYIKKNRENELARQLGAYVKASHDENNYEWSGKPAI